MSARTEKIQRNTRRREAERSKETPVLATSAEISGVTTEIVKVTPELAEQWLKENIANRNYNRHVASKYAHDMVEGRWEFTGDPIQFSEEGFLQNGQHRLNAVVIANRCVPFLVIRGLQDKAKDHMDLGRKRKLGDILKISGYENALTLAAVSRGALSWLAGYESNANRNQISDQQCLEFFISDAERITEATAIADQYRTRIGLSTKLLGTFVFMGLTKGALPEEMDAFLASIANYQTMGAGDPRSALIARISRAKNQREQMPVQYILSILVRTWNGVQNKEELTRFPSNYDKIPNMRIK